jgi:hypothetical protein
MSKITIITGGNRGLSSADALYAAKKELTVSLPTTEIRIKLKL